MFTIRHKRRAPSTGWAVYACSSYCVTQENDRAVITFVGVKPDASSKELVIGPGETAYVMTNDTGVTIDVIRGLQSRPS